MTTRHLKANSRGSWTNVLQFDEDNAFDIYHACEILLRASGATVSFKVTNDAGVTLASLDARQKPGFWQIR